MSRVYNIACALIVATACIAGALYGVWWLLTMIGVSLVVTLIVDVLLDEIVLSREASDNLSLGVFTLTIAVLGAKVWVLG